MDTLKYIVKRLLLSIVILLGVSIIIYGLARMMPTDYVDQQYSSQLAQGLMKQEDIDRIKEIYGLNMPDAYLDGTLDASSAYGGKRLRKSTKEATYDNLQYFVVSMEDWLTGSYDGKVKGTNYRLTLENGSDAYTVYEVGKAKEEIRQEQVFDSNGDPVLDENGNPTYEDVITLVESLVPVESGTYAIAEDAKADATSWKITLTAESGATYAFNVEYKIASGGDKFGAILGGYFTWLGNLLQGDLGTSFKYKKPVGKVIVQNMGISFGIAFIATILQFLIAIPLGIKAATNQYGVIDYTVTVIALMGISLPTFFLGALVIRVFAIELGWFELGGLTSNNLPLGASGIMVFGDMLWHMVLPMFVLVILSVGSLMRYTRTNTLEVLNADYIRTARAKGLSERAVIYKHAFRNTMIPLVTMMAGILPSLFGGAMITETVFAIPGIGKLAYDALLVADVPFIMGYNMFLAIMTVIGTLLSDLMYAVVDPRVKLSR